MFQWMLLSATSLLLPLLMLILGYRYSTKVPKSMKSGYRTRRSMLSRETWVYAHRKLGKIWKWLGWITFIASAAFPMLLLNMDEDEAGMALSVLCVVQTIPFVASIIPVERALKMNFDENGVPNDAETLFECREDEDPPPSS